MTPVMAIETWPITRFVPYERNPRKNDHVVDQMVESIKEFGFKIPILARSNGEVVDGHLRLKAAAKLSLAELPVILCDEWSEAQVRAFRLMVNRSVAWADWDEQLLALELAALKELDFDLKLTGFEEGEIAEFLAGGATDTTGSLSDRFLVPPFSVLDARQGYWQERKRAWLALGIESELGRGENALGFSETVNMTQAGKNPRRHLNRNASAIPGGGSGKNSAYMFKTPDGYKAIFKE